MPYDGDSYKFKGWYNSICNSFAQWKPDDLDKIRILEANTIGAPREVVQTFRVAYGDDPSRAVHTIMDKLTKRFGTSLSISSELRGKT